MPFRTIRLKPWTLVLTAVVIAAVLLSHVRRDALDDPTQTSHR